MQVFCFVLTPVIFLMACVSLVLGEFSPDIHLFLEGISFANVLLLLKGKSTQGIFPSKLI